MISTSTSVSETPLNSDLSSFIKGRKKTLTYYPSEKPSGIKVPVVDLLQVTPGYDPFRDANAVNAFFDVNAAQQAIDFFCHPKDHVLVFVEDALDECAGKPFSLEKWQACFLANLYGWKIKMRVSRSKKPRIVRRYRKALLYVPRKNGKTPFIAGNALYILTSQGGYGVQVYSAAADREQAALVIRHASGMVNAEPELHRSLGLRHMKSTKEIRFEAANGHFKALSSDAETKHGLSVSCGILEELHAHETRDLCDVITTGVAAKAEPLLFYVTTADFLQDSICNEVYEQACLARDQQDYDPYFFPMIYEAKDTDDYQDERVWQKANPNLGVSVSLSYLEDEARRAKREPSYRNTFKRLHLNIRTQVSSIWLDMEYYDKCGSLNFEIPNLPNQLLPDEALCQNLLEAGKLGQSSFDDTLSPEPIAAGHHENISNTETIILKKAVAFQKFWRMYFRINRHLDVCRCYLGIDISSLKDLTALVLWFPYFNITLPWIYVPAEYIEARSHKDAVPFDRWEKFGFIEPVTGAVIDHDIIKEQALTLLEEYQVRNVAFDAHQIGIVYTYLAKHGYEDILFKVRQTHLHMNSPAKRLESMIMQQEFAHGFHPVLRWAASNAVIKEDGEGNIKPYKADSTDKIDPLIADLFAINAADIDLQNNPFESHGLLDLEPGKTSKQIEELFGYDSPNRSSIDLDALDREIFGN